MSDYKALVGRVRDEYTATDSLHRDLADAVEALMVSRDAFEKGFNGAEKLRHAAEAERDALRAQLDAMTTEWSAPDTASVKTVPFWVGYGDDEKLARATAEALSGPVYKRLVDPWVEVD